MAEAQVSEEAQKIEGAETELSKELQDEMDKQIRDRLTAVKLAEERVAKAEERHRQALESLKKFKTGGIITKEERLRREAEEAERLFRGSIKTIPQVEEETKVAFEEAKQLREEGKDKQAEELEKEALNEEHGVKKQELLKKNQEEMGLIAKIAMKGLEVRRMGSKIHHTSEKEKAAKLKEEKYNLEYEKLEMEEGYKVFHGEVLELKGDMERLEYKTCM